MDIVADNEEATKVIEQTKQSVEENPPTMKINGDAKNVVKAADVASASVEKKHPVMKINGDANNAVKAADIAVSHIQGLNPAISITANTGNMLLAIHNALNRQFSISVAAHVSGLPTSNAAGTFHAHASGTAYNVINTLPAHARGTNVSLQEDETALVNEVGAEGLIRNGVFSILPGGMHVENLKKGDVILSHSQVKALMSTGRASGKGHLVGGARALASGTLAYNGMPAHSGTAGGWNPKPNTPGATTPSSGVSSKTENNVNKAATTVSDAAKKSADAIQEAIKNFQDAIKDWFDMAEITLERTQRELDRFLTQSELATDTRTKNKYIDQAIKLIGNEKDTKSLMGRNKRAYDAYMA